MTLGDPKNAVTPPAGDMVGSAPARHRGGRQLQVGCEGGSAATTPNDFVCCHHGNARYEKRKLNASGITISVIDRKGPLVHSGPVLTKSELLEAVEAQAGSRAEIARVLTLAPARVTELYAGKRDLSFDEARKLIHHYQIGGERGPASVAEFATVTKWVWRGRSIKST